MEISSDRIHWIDVAKGLMIIGVVLNHIPNLCTRQGVNISSFPWWITFGSAYGVFTMQSFFILSGYTSHFDIGPLPFLWKQVKALLFPYVSFTLICFGFEHLYFNEPFYLDCFGEEYFFLVEGYWFLTALFLAKILVYFFHKTKNCWAELSLGLVLLIIGFAISEFYSNKAEPSHYHNWFHYRNGLCMALFITVGSIFKSYKIVEKKGLIISILYTVFYCITFPLLLLRIPYSRYLAAPSYTHYFVPNLSDVNGFFMIPSYLFYTITGSIMIFWICQKLRQSKFLEFFGKSSLIVYCVHFSFLKLFIKLLSPYYIKDNIVGSGLFFLIIAVLTLLSSAIVAKVFEYKPFIYLVGKFKSKKA